LWKFETHQDRKITSKKLNKIYNSDKNVDKTYFLNSVLVYIYLPKASKYLYISLNISIFLPWASKTLCNSDKIWKVWKKSNLFKFALCPTVRGITLHLKG
jgi:hypothetical protein